MYLSHFPSIVITVQSQEDSKNYSSIYAGTGLGHGELCESKTI